MKYNKYRISKDNPRMILDEYGDEFLLFKGLHLCDLYKILKLLNTQLNEY